MTSEIVELKIQEEKQSLELTKRKSDEIEYQIKIKSLTQASADCEKLTEENKVLLKNNTQFEKERDLASDKFKEEQIKRKALLNEIEDIKGKIRVYARIRPYSNTEAEDPEKSKMCMQINDELSVTVHGRIDNNYNFSSVFGPDSTQD